MFKKLVASAVVIAGMTVLASGVHAAPVVYFGENQNPNNGVSGNPLTARSNFLSNLNGVVSQGFEGFATGPRTSLPLEFTGSGSSTLNATLTGTGSVVNAGGAGRYNTTAGGSQWWEVQGSFSITFATAISAFGFYGTDIGDFNGQITLALTDINDAVTEITVDNTVNGADGSLLFFGFIDAQNSYKSITFGNTASGTDVFGFDDMVIGDRGQIGNPVPEPGTLALVGLSLMGLAVSRRRKSA